jgi:hypothetical protein
MAKKLRESRTISYLVGFVLGLAIVPPIITTLSSVGISPYWAIPIDALAIILIGEVTHIQLWRKGNRP